MAQFEMYRDTASEYRWRLRSSNGRTVADSGESYTSASACRNGIAAVKQRAASGPYDVYQDARGFWRWRLKAVNGRIIADSAEGYSSRSAVDEAIRWMRGNAPGAPVVDKAA